MLAHNAEQSNKQARNKVGWLVLLLSGSCELVRGFCGAHLDCALMFVEC